MDYQLLGCSSVIETRSHPTTDYGTSHLHTAFLAVHDASQEGIGTVAQRQDNKERFIAYASHTLKPPERKWSTFDRELWAVVWSVKHFLSGSVFTVITDHKPLLNLRKEPVDNDPTGRHSRWILELDVYDYNLLHRESKQHAKANAMSRRPDPKIHNTAVQCVNSTITSTDRHNTTSV